MSLPILYKGANRIIVRSLFLEDGVTPLLASSLSSAVAKLYQGSTLIETYTRGEDGELRNGNETNQLELEITSALSAQLTPGTALKVRWELSVADAEFENDGDLFRDTQVESVFMIA